MRLGKDVLEADLYGVLGVLPDATDSEIRVAYRHQARCSHPDLNQADPDAMPRMKKLNVAARVLLDPALRRAYDRAPRGPRRASASATRSARHHRAWFERRELSFDDDWAAPTPEARAETGGGFGAFFQELRGRDGQLSFQVQALVESLSMRQQLGVAALLCAVALGLIIMASPKGLIGDTVQPTTIDPGALYP